MLDQFNREIYYLRISVTDRCNLRCTYCMPKDGIKLKRHDEILSFEEILEIVKTAVKLGFYKFRLTGGEPLVRRGIVDLVKMLSSVQEVQTLAMTTNGNLSEALAGIIAAKDAGFEKTKLNIVLVDGFNDDEKEDFMKFADDNNLKARFIKKMDLKSGDYYKVEGGEGGHCAICNRIRLTADGKLRPCLFSDYEVDIRKEPSLEDAFLKVVNHKPERGYKTSNREMYQIGG